MKDNETTYLLKKKETISQYLILQMEGCIQTEYVEIVNQWLIEYWIVAMYYNDRKWHTYYSYGIALRLQEFI